MRNRIAAGMLSLVLAAGLCLSPDMAVKVQAQARSSSAEQEIEQEDREMEEHLREEAMQEIPEGSFELKMADTDADDQEEFGEFSQETPGDIFSPEESFEPGASAFTEETDQFSAQESEAEFQDGDTVLFSDDPGEPGQGGQTPQNVTEVTLQAEEGTDITGLLNTLLSQVRYKATDENPYKVIIPPGNYQLTSTICMYSNIHLYAVGAVITKTSTTKHLLLRLGDTEDSAGGYDGYRNITIEGGTWDSNYEGCEGKEDPGGFVGFRIGHASHVVIKDAVFLNNLKSHFVELGGVKDARVTGCTFRGYWTPYEGGGQECIQIDACRDFIFPSYTPFDGAVCEDIVIDGNTFEDVFAGVGSHSMMFDRPYKNITITNNTFRNIKKRAVWCLNYQDSLVSGNVMENVGGGVYVRSIYSGNTHVMEEEQVNNTMNQQPQNLVIADNRIKLAQPGIIGSSLWRSYGIQIIGEQLKDSQNGVPDGLYIIKGVTVRGNSVTGPGNGIRLCLADNCEVTGNSISLDNPKKFTNLGIYLGASSKNAVKNNTVEKARNAGIYVYNGSASYKTSSTDNVLAGNKVSGCYTDGILIDNTSNKTTLQGNSSQKNKGSGISVYRSELTSLSSNKTAGNQRYGIFADHANIKAQKGNQMNGNGASYAMYMNGCKGKAQSLRKIQVNQVTSKAKTLTGKAVGGKAITAVLKKNNTKIGNAKINSLGQYKIPVKSLKKGSVLVLSVTDKYKNSVTDERKVG